MTAAELLAQLNALSSDLDSAIIVYSPFPGQTIRASNYNYLPDPTNILQLVIYGFAQAVPFPLTVDSLRFRLRQLGPVQLAAPVYIPGITGFVEISSITTYPSDDFNINSYVSLNGPFTAPRPYGPDPIPGNRRNQRSGQPLWPNIPVADP